MVNFQLAAANFASSCLHSAATSEYNVCNTQNESGTLALGYFSLIHSRQPGGSVTTFAEAFLRSILTGRCQSPFHAAMTARPAVARGSDRTICAFSSR